QTYCHTHSNSLSNKMDNSLLAVRGINHKYIVVVGREVMSFKRKNGQAPAKKDYTKLKTPHTYAIIFFVVIVCWLLTYLIPAGKFSTHTIEYTDADGGTATRTVLMADTFRYYYNLDTDFVADALAEISQDQAVMEEWEVD